MDRAQLECVGVAHAIGPLPRRPRSRELSWDRRQWFPLAVGGCRLDPQDERGSESSTCYRELTGEFGEPVYDRVEAPATPEQKEILERLSPQQVRSTDLVGEKIQAILTRAPGNSAPIGGLKVVAESGWFAARPSGTEDIYKIYAESFRGADRLRRILEEAQAIVSEALGAPLQAKSPSRTNVKETP